MRIKPILLFIFTCTITTAVSANKADLCTYPKGFTTGFDMKAYKQCAQSIQLCPASHIFRDAKCAAQKLQRPSCRQLAALAKKLEVDAQMISAKKSADYTTLTIFFPADGGEQYYLLSPKGCLLNTNLNPADIDASFKRSFAGKDLYIEVKDAPRYSLLPDGSKRFSVTIEGRNQCRACETLVTSEVGFDFTKDDNWKKATVLQYHRSTR